MYYDFYYLCRLHILYLQHNYNNTAKTNPTTASPAQARFAPAAPLKMTGPLAVVGPTGTLVGDTLFELLIMIVVPLLLGFGGPPLEAEAGAVVRVIRVG